jgi:uncharacterized protein (DUF488 family)
MKLWTVGHSTLDGTAFVEMLAAHGIAQLADVRRYPSSRRQPQFNAPVLARRLGDAGIGYAHLESLGGRREPKPDSRNGGWREAGFRGYADYMETPSFDDAMQGLLAFAEHAPTTILCAERDWRECHRGLMSDWLKLRHIEVLHIVDATRVEPHRYTEPASVTGGRLAYPAPTQGLLDLGN